MKESSGELSSVANPVLKNFLRAMQTQGRAAFPELNRSLESWMYKYTKLS